MPSWQNLLEQERANTGKLLLHRIVSMLHKLRIKLSSQDPKKTRTPEQNEHEYRYR